MKKVLLIVAVCVSLAMVSIACATTKMPKTIIGASENRTEAPNPAPAPMQPVRTLNLTPADPQPPSGATLPQPQPPQTPAPAPLATGGEVGKVMFRFNQPVNAFYVTFFSDEGKRLQKFNPTDHVEFTKVKPGEYWGNFCGAGGRWALDEGGGGNPNFDVWVSVDGGANWRQLTKADAVQVSGKYWNFRVVVK